MSVSAWPHRWQNDKKTWHWLTGLALPKCPTEPCILAKVARPTAVATLQFDATQIGQGWVRSPPQRQRQRERERSLNWALARVTVELLDCLLQCVSRSVCVCMCSCLYVCVSSCVWVEPETRRHKLLAPETVAVARLKHILWLCRLYYPMFISLTWLCIYLILYIIYILYIYHSSITRQHTLEADSSILSYLSPFIPCVIHISRCLNLSANLSVTWQLPVRAHTNTHKHTHVHTHSRISAPFPHTGNFN